MTEPSEHVETGESVENVVVVEPDDYRKTQKLKSIQEAKDGFKEYIQNKSEKFRELEQTWANPHEALKKQRAVALSSYASELIPLIEEGMDNGTVQESDLKVEIREGNATLDIREITEEIGLIDVGGEDVPLPSVTCMKTYRQLERIERKLGLGLDLEEEKSPAEI